MFGENRRGTPVIYPEIIGMVALFLCLYIDKNVDTLLDVDDDDVLVGGWRCLHSERGGIITTTHSSTRQGMDLSGGKLI